MRFLLHHASKHVSDGAGVPDDISVRAVHFRYDAIASEDGQLREAKREVSEFAHDKRPINRGLSKFSQSFVLCVIL